MRAAQSCIKGIQQGHAGIKCSLCTSVCQTRHLPLFYKIGEVVVGGGDSEKVHVEVGHVDAWGEDF